MMARHIAATCPNCNKLLVEGPDNLPKPGWCEQCWTHYDLTEREAAMTWRKMALHERANEIAAIGEGVVAKYGVSATEYQRVADFTNRRNSVVVRHGDVSPDKQALLSLARGLSDTGALSEMIDNALDCSQRKRDGACVKVEIKFNLSEGLIRVSDDAGGMTADELLRCLTLGSQSPDGHGKNVIGRFGVGAKEAIYHFWREVSIFTRDLRSDGIETFLPVSWLDQRSWEVEIIQSEVPIGTSVFEIGVLEKFDFNKDLIERELLDRYRKSIEAGRLIIHLDGVEIKKDGTTLLLYPPELYPRKYNFWIREVMVDLDVAMLAKEATSSGIYFYFFGRRFAHWAWTDPLAKTIFVSPPQSRLNSHFRVEINFNGPVDDVPINANKDEVDTSKDIFRTLARIVAKIVQPYLSIVNWLSKDNAMGYLQKNFSGSQNRHILLNDASPGLIKRIELGKVYEAMALPKSRVADHSNLITVIRNDRQGAIAVDSPPDAAPTDDTLTGGDLPIRNDSIKPPVPPAMTPTKDADSDSLRSTSSTSPVQHPNGVIQPLAPSAVLTVSLFSTNVEDVAYFREQLERSATSLGIKFTIS